MNNVDIKGERGDAVKVWGETVAAAELPPARPLAECWRGLGPAAAALLSTDTEDRFRDSLLISIKLSQQQQNKMEVSGYQESFLKFIFYIQLKC